MATTLTLAFSHLMGEGIRADSLCVIFAQPPGFRRVLDLRTAPQLKLELRAFATEYGLSDGLCAF